MNNQKGFTLIEISVVLVIVSIITYGLIFSLNSSPERLISKDTYKIKKFLESVKDTAAITNITYLVALHNQTFYLYKKGKTSWEKINKDGFIGIDKDIETVASGEVSIETNKVDGLYPGWFFWPTGEVSQGSIQLSYNGVKDSSEKLIIWDSLLNYEK